MEKKAKQKAINTLKRLEEIKKRIEKFNSRKTIRRIIRPQSWIRNEPTSHEWD